MRAVILIEDTPQGIRYLGSVVHSGVNDGVDRSLAVMLAAQVELMVRTLQKSHALVVTSDERPLLPAPRR